MAERKQLEFFVLRYVPDAVKEEFVNVGVLMMERGGGFAEIKFTRDWRRVYCLDPQADVEWMLAVEKEIRERLLGSEDRDVMMAKLQTSLSNVIDLSTKKVCLAEDPAQEMALLTSLYLERPMAAAVKRAATGRQKILAGMTEAFENAGVFELMMKEMPVAAYTKPGDPFKCDFGYRTGNEFKLFHAVSLKAGVDQAVMLAGRYPRIAAGMERVVGVSSRLTAVVENDLVWTPGVMEFARAAMTDEGIRVAELREMAGIAEVAKREIR